MNNLKDIIDSRLENLYLSDELKEKILSDSKPKRFISKFRPAKMIAAAAAVILIVGIINIQAVIAFIGGMFFVPGEGLTRNDITYYGLENPIVLTMDSGTTTIEFITKVTRNDKTELSIYIDSRDNFAFPSNSGNAVLGISADGEVVLSDVILNAIYGLTTGTLNGAYDEKTVTYYYFTEDFPDINEFDLTVFGVETRVSLTEQPGKTAISQNNGGITFAAYKFNGVNAFFAAAVYDDNAGNDYMATVLGSSYLSLGNKIYNEKGEEILLSGMGSMGGNGNYLLVRIHVRDRNSEIKEIQGQALEIVYRPKSQRVIEIPVPKDGESIKTDIAIKIGSQIFTINEVRREGDVIYYENNARQKIFQPDSPEFAQTVKNRETFISEVSFIFGETGANVARMEGGQIWNFDLEKETLQFWFSSATLIQYGDFNIKFE